MGRGKSYFPYTMYGKSVVASLTGVGSASSAIELFGKFNFTIYGTGADQLINLKKSFDGTTYFLVASYAAVGVYQFEEPETGVNYKSDVSSLGSGTAVIRLSQ